MAALSDIQLLELLNKFRTGNCTDAELQTLQQWFDETGEQEARWQLPESVKGSVTGEMYEAFRKKIAADNSKRKVRSIKRLIAVAASVLLVLSGAYMLYNSKQGNKPQQTVTDVAPGRNGALLTLADGRTIVLDSAGNGNIAQQNGAQVINAEGQLSYKATGGNAGPVAYNTLSTPPARQYSLVLPDGTKVWLNAASSIKYPVTFTGAERKVSITGEAYFEVAHNKAMPFKVQAGSTEILDLGTAFNVYAYNDEPVLKATLIQGAIQVQDKVLKPGQQAQLSGGTMQIVKLPDAAEAIAWKNGEINFENTDVATLLRQIARWYDVEIVYQSKLPATQLLGSISRQTNLSTIIKMLNTYNISCRLDGRRLIVL